MKSSTAPPKKTRVTKARRVGGGVPIDEMRRLMRVYGSIKCLRRRQKPEGDEGAKDDSVKRKFYRWFPDLDERFEKDAGGHYRPKFGHEAEMKYREEMRTVDGEDLTRKRVMRRKQRLVGMSAKAPTTKSSTVSTDFARVSPGPPPHAMSSLSFPKRVEEWGIGTVDELASDHNLRMESADSVAGTEPLDCSFIAEGGIFDDVEGIFYGQTNQDCQDTIVSSDSTSISLEEQGPQSSEESDFADIQDMLDKTIEECCEEILGSDDDNSGVSSFLFGMISG